MNATFFKEAIGLDNEYIYVELHSDLKGGWEVIAKTGKRQGREHAKELFVRRAKTFSKGEEIFHSIREDYRRRKWKEL